jgi:hypothetical protein
MGGGVAGHRWRRGMGGLGLLLGSEVEREDRAGGGGREGTELAVLCCAGLRSPEERV